MPESYSSFQQLFLTGGGYCLPSKVTCTAPHYALRLVCWLCFMHLFEVGRKAQPDLCSSSDPNAFTDGRFNDFWLMLIGF